jgi:Fic family protein
MKRPYSMERRRWEATPAALGGRRARQAFEYEAYVPACLAAWEPLIPASLADAMGRAEQACRELNGDPPALANLEAMARQLLRAESVASSRIEGLVLSHRRLAHAAYTQDASDVSAQSVLANIAAMEDAIATAASGGELTAGVIERLHRRLFEGTRDSRIGGRIREDQNWIGGDASSPARAEFVPPPPERVRPLMDDLCAWMNRVDLPAVLQAAVAHAQFETIHPFEDGNGRVGRALIHIVLVGRGVTPSFTPPISLVLAARANRYVRGLTTFRFDDTDDWYEVFSEAVYDAARGAHVFAERVEALKEEWREQAGHPRRGSAAAALIDRLASHPIVDLRSARELTAASDEAARLALARLERAGVLSPTRAGVKRNRAWETVGLFALLDDFERDLGSANRTPRLTRR